MWDFYSQEDIPSGRIVFSGVDAVEFAPPGHVPNDLINDLPAIRLEGADDATKWRFTASIGSIAPDGTTTEVILHVTGRDVHLEDPSRPGLEIRE